MFLISVAFVLIIAGNVQAQALVSLGASVEAIIGNDGNVQPDDDYFSKFLQARNVYQHRRVTLISFDIKGLKTDIQWFANMSLNMIGVRGGTVKIYGVIEELDNIDETLTWEDAPGVQDDLIADPVALDMDELTDILLSIKVPGGDEKVSSDTSQALDDFLNSDTDGTVTLLLAPEKEGTDVMIRSGSVSLEGEIIFPTAAMVVNDVNLPAGFDQAQKDRLELIGYAVTVTTGSDVADGVFTPEDANTFDVLVVSESIGSSQANNLIGANVPMMHGESYGWSRHFFTEGLNKTWKSDPCGMVDIVNDTHPIIVDAGLSAGPVQFFTNPAASWTTDLVDSLVAGAENLAQITSDANDFTIIFAIEAGTKLANETLAGNRIVGFSLPGQAPLDANDMTDEAWALFDAAIAWLDPLETPSRAAMVVNDAHLTAGFDNAQKDQLYSLGYAVTVTTGSDVADGLFTAEYAETFDVLVVSESIGSSQANNLIGVNVPMMHEESYGWSRHFFTQGLKKTWKSDPNGMVDIVNDTHPIIADAGLSAGPVQFFTNPAASWTTDLVASLVPGAENLAQITSDANDFTIIFAIEAGTELADPNMVAANRVVGFSLPGQSPLVAADMTDKAWALFDAAIAWLDPEE
jgi:hypothetical protein